jgi:hypothetical protein
MPSNYLAIIRMEREGVEKTGVAGLMSGVQGIGIRGGKAENLEKSRTINKMRERSKRARFNAVWACGMLILPSNQGVSIHQGMLHPAS